MAGELGIQPPPYRTSGCGVSLVDPTDDPAASSQHDRQREIDGGRNGWQTTSGYENPLFIFKEAPRLRNKCSAPGFHRNSYRGRRVLGRGSPGNYLFYCPGGQNLGVSGTLRKSWERYRLGESQLSICGPSEASQGLQTRPNNRVFALRSLGFRSSGCCDSNHVPMDGC
jgi:hypothetical protein